MRKPIVGPYTNNQPRDYSVQHAYYSIKTAHGTKHLNTREDDMMDDTVTVSADDEVDVGLYIKSSDGGIEEGSAQAYMSSEQARDLAKRLLRAAIAHENDKRYYER